MSNNQVKVLPEAHVPIRILFAELLSEFLDFFLEMRLNFPIWMMKEYMGREIKNDG